jgi:hypothetical protein
MLKPGYVMLVVNFGKRAMRWLKNGYILFYVLAYYLTEK